MQGVDPTLVDVLSLEYLRVVCLGQIGRQRTVEVHRARAVMAAIVVDALEVAYAVC